MTKRKNEKKKRKKRLLKQIVGQVKQQEKHQNKINKKEFRLDTTGGYYEGEILRFKQKEQERKEKLKKLEK